MKQDITNDYELKDCQKTDKRTIASVFFFSMSDKCYYFGDVGMPFKHASGFLGFSGLTSALNMKPSTS